MAVMLADLIPHGDPSLGGYIGLMAAGFLIGTIGHITKLVFLQIVGIGLIFIGVLVLPLLTQGG